MQSGPYQTNTLPIISRPPLIQQVKELLWDNLAVSELQAVLNSLSISLIEGTSTVFLSGEHLSNEIEFTLTAENEAT